MADQSPSAESASGPDGGSTAAYPGTRAAQGSRGHGGGGRVGVSMTRSILTWPVFALAVLLTLGLAGLNGAMVGLRPDG